MIATKVLVTCNLKKNKRNPDTINESNKVKD
jgi:hypothetical protein